MVPIYSIDSAISMWNAEHEWTVYLPPLPALSLSCLRLPILTVCPASASYITVMRECYEGYVLYNFLRLMIFYCGGDSGLLEWSTSRTSQPTTPSQ
jgi:hypothetical protein